MSFAATMDCGLIHAENVTGPLKFMLALLPRSTYAFPLKLNAPPDSPGTRVALMMLPLFPKPESSIATLPLASLKAQ